MRRRFVPMLLAPLLASCQPPAIAVNAAFLDNELAFVAANSGGSDSSFCWKEATVVDDSLRTVWHFDAPNTGRCRALFPLFYGRAPEGAETAAPASRLEPGRLYLFIGDATTSISGAFALSRAGRSLIVHNVDPESPAADALRLRWLQRAQAGRADGPLPAAEAGRR